MLDCIGFFVFVRNSPGSTNLNITPPIWRSPRTRSVFSTCKSVMNTRRFHVLSPTWIILIASVRFQHSTVYIFVRHHTSARETRDNFVSSYSSPVQLFFPSRICTIYGTTMIRNRFFNIAGYPSSSPHLPSELLRHRKFRSCMNHECFVDSKKIMNWKCLNTNLCGYDKTDDKFHIKNQP